MVLKTDTQELTIILMSKTICTKPVYVETPHNRKCILNHRPLYNYYCNHQGVL